MTISMAVLMTSNENFQFKNYRVFKKIRIFYRNSSKIQNISRALHDSESIVLYNQDFRRY